ncbi:hypothetical protein EAE96_002075 [Botrytis aclada]|nr:hypothetical protein EAE96_002075 [Botrytis aclada]
MPKSERHVEWLDNYFKDNNVNGDLYLTSGEIADLCNDALDTKAFTKGPSPKNRKIMTDGVDAQIVGRHMQELKKKAAGKPRATRRTQSAIARMDRILKQRDGRLWAGDRMLLAMLNQTNPENIKNYAEEKARKEGKRAKSAGGQVLQDWEARKRLRVASNKYANKMWAEYNKSGKKDEYLQKLANGLISLETGEAIKGNSINHPGSSLNPANGYIESTSNGDGDDEAVDADAGQAIVDDDHLMGNGIGKESESQTGYNFAAHSVEYPDHIKGLPQSQMQVENGANNEELNLAGGNAENAGSQMGLEQISCNTNRHFIKHPVFYNAEIGVPNPRTNLSKYEASNIRAMTQDKRPMPAPTEPYRDNAHSSHIHMGFQPSPQIESSRHAGEPVRQRQNGRSRVITHEEQETRASHTGYQIHRRQCRYPDVRQMLPVSLPKKRKEPLVDEEVLGVRPSKRQCQPEGNLQSERQPEPEQQSPLKHQHNRLVIEESDIEESFEPSSNIRPNFSRTINSMIIEEPKDLQERDMRGLAASTVRSNHENVDQGREAGIWSIVAHPESGLQTAHVFCRESRQSGRLGRRSGDKPDDAIVIPEDCEEIETVEPSQGMGDRVSVDGRQPVKTDNKPDNLESVSSPKVHANIWSFQSRTRACEEPSKSPWQAFHHSDGISTAIYMRPTRRTFLGTTSQ